jgi:alkyl sulfatase BDS1-like metallo-beta-lactamase superfamily hydrolase
MSAMSLDQLLDYLAVRLNGQRADGEDFKMNLEINDTSDRALIQVKNSVLNFWVDESSTEADVTVYMPRKTLEQLALDPSAPPADVIASGDSSVFERFIGMLDVFDPGFNIVLP